MLKVILLVLFVSACGLNTARVQKKTLDGEPLRTFAAHSFEDGRIRLPKVTMFMWKKEGFNGPTIARVNKLSGLIDYLDGEGLKLQKEQEPLDRAKEEKLSLRRDKSALQKEIKAQEKVVQEAQAELESAQTAGDPQLIELAMQKVQVETQKLEDIKIKNNTRIAEIEQQVKELDSYINVKEPELNKRRDEIAMQALAAAEEIRSLTDWFEAQPKEFGVNLREVENQNTLKSELIVDVFIRGWDPVDGLGARTFTSFSSDVDVPGFAPDEKMDWGAITDVKYSAQGGKVSFLLHAGHGYTYRFEFLRSDYNDPFGRINFYGDVVRSRKGEPDRYGVVKLCDRKN